MSLQEIVMGVGHGWGGVTRLGKDKDEEIFARADTTAWRSRTVMDKCGGVVLVKS